MQSTILITYYQESNLAVGMVKLKNDAETIAEHVFEHQTHWQALRTVLEDARLIGADHLRIFSTIKFDLSKTPEEPANTGKVYIPEKGGRGKYIHAKWGGNADYWKVLTLIHEYKSYSFQTVQPEQIPGTVKLWQEHQ